MMHLPRNELLFQLRQDYTYIIRTLKNPSIDPERKRRLERWKRRIRNLYLDLTSEEIEYFIPEN